MKVLLKDISKEYKDGGDVLKALSNISIEINDNEFIGIIGPSGSGKSTLLNIIGMTDEKYTGEYIFNNTNVEKDSNKLGAVRNKNFGYVFQGFGLINNISVYKNIKIPLEYGKNSKGDIQNRIKNILSEFNLLDKINSLPSELSGGQCQKVAIARAIINDPQIILADEPTASLDKDSRKVVVKILCELHRRGKTIVLVTHDLKLIKYCTRVIEIEDGVIKEDYKKENEVYEQ